MMVGSRKVVKGVVITVIINMNTLLVWLLVLSPLFINASFIKGHSRSPVFLHSRSSLFNLHGGAQVHVKHEDLSPPNTLHKQDGIVEDDPTDDNDIAYASIGILNFSTTQNKPSARIVVCYRDKDLTGEICNESWELDTKGSGYTGDFLAAAETVGCLCNGIVICLTDDQLHNNDTKALDDFLFCIAQGMVRRMESTHDVNNEIVVPVTITFGDKDVDKEYQAAKDHIQQYLRAAIASSSAQEKHWNANKSCNVEVNVSSSFSDQLGTATELILSRTSQNTSRHNLVPHSMFGELASSMHINICKRLSLTQNYGITKPGGWRKMTPLHTSDDYNLVTNEEITVDSPTLTRKLSPGFKQKVESLMATLFVDTEKSLQEMSVSIDDAFFELTNEDASDAPIPEFGGDFDDIVNGINDSFFALIHTSSATLSEYDLEWANGMF